MRLSTEELYEYYFKDRYVNINAMCASFSIHKKRDKKGEFVNKKYLIPEVFGFYSYYDLVEMLSYEEKMRNTISYAQQLIIDIEAIMDQYKIKGSVTKLAKLAGIIHQQVPNLNISYEVALKVIDRIETKIKSLSIEAIRDLKLELEKVSK